MILLINYTIPSNNRELRPKPTFFPFLKIIPYQVITGNYDKSRAKGRCGRIIPYQVITGNYDSSASSSVPAAIIPYQVITGNYDIALIMLQVF